MSYGPVNRIYKTIKDVSSNVRSNITNFIQNHTDYMPSGISARHVLPVLLGIGATAFTADGADLDAKVAQAVSGKDVPVAASSAPIDYQLRGLQQLRDRAQRQYDRADKILSGSSLNKADRIKYSAYKTKLQTTLESLDSRIDGYQPQGAKPVAPVVSKPYEGRNDDSDDRVAAVSPQIKPVASTRSTLPVTGGADPDTTNVVKVADASAVPYSKPKVRTSKRIPATPIIGVPKRKTSASAGGNDEGFKVSSYIGGRYFQAEGNEGDVEAVGGVDLYFVNAERIKWIVGADGNVGPDSMGWDLDTRLNYQVADRHVLGLFGAVGQDERSQIDGYEVDDITPDVDPANWVNLGGKWVWRARDDKKSPLDLGVKARYIMEGTDEDVTLSDGRPADLVGYTGWQLDGNIFVPRETWLIKAGLGYHSLDPNSGDYDPVDGVNASVGGKVHFQPNLFGWKPKLQLNLDYMFAGEDLFQVGMLSMGTQTPLNPRGDNMDYHLVEDEGYVWTRHLFPGQVPTTPITPVIPPESTPIPPTEPDREGPRDPDTPTAPEREGDRTPVPGASVTAPTVSGPNTPRT